MTQDEIDAGGNLSNTVVADSAESDPAEDSLDIPIDQGPAIAVEKSSTVTTIGAAGVVVPYTFVVTNTGNQTLTGITVTDPNCDAAPVYVSGDTNLDNKLQLSESWTYTCNHTVTQDEIDAGGNLSNTVVADSAESDPAEDSLDIPIDQGPAIAVEKSSTTTSLSAPATVNYSYLVTNTGNVTPTSISLVDDNDNNDMSGPATTLAVGASMTCTATHTFTQAELNANGSPTAGSGNLTNNVTADSNETAPVQDTLTIPINRPVTAQILPTATTCSELPGWSREPPVRELHR